MSEETLGMGCVSGGPATPRNLAHHDRIERLDRVIYLRWTSGPNYERVFLCIEDGEPDMHDLATMTYKQAGIFAAAYRAAKPLPLAEIAVVNAED